MIIEENQKTFNQQSAYLANQKIQHISGDINYELQKINEPISAVYIDGTNSYVGTYNILHWIGRTPSIKFVAVTLAMRYAWSKIKKQERRIKFPYTYKKKYLVEKTKKNGVTCERNGDEIFDMLDRNFEVMEYSSYVGISTKHSGLGSQMMTIVFERKCASI